MLKKVIDKFINHKKLIISILSLFIIGGIVVTCGSDYYYGFQADNLKNKDMQYITGAAKIINEPIKPIAPKYPIANYGSMWKYPNNYSNVEYSSSYLKYLDDLQKYNTDITTYSDNVDKYNNDMKNYNDTLKSYQTEFLSICSEYSTDYIPVIGNEIENAQLANGFTYAYKKLPGGDKLKFMEKIDDVIQKYKR